MTKSIATELAVWNAREKENGPFVARVPLTLLAFSGVRQFSSLRISQVQDRDN